MNAPLRTLHVGAIVEPRAEMITGSERYYFDLLRALPAHDVAVRGIVVGALDQRYARDPVEAIAPCGARAWTRIAAARRAVARLASETDVAVSHFAPHAYPLIDQLANAGRFVAHVHGSWTLEALLQGGTHWSRLPLRAAQEFTVYHRAARVVVLFAAYARMLEVVYRVAAEKIRIIPGGVDLRRFAPAMSRAEARDALGWPRDAAIVLLPARLVRGKGIANAIDAIDLVRGRVRDALLVVAGIGELDAQVRARVRERGLERWVRFAGHIDDLAVAYRAADATLATSIGNDGFGLVVYESLACGTPPLLVPLGWAPASAPAALTFADGAAPRQIAALIGDALTGRRALPDAATCRAFVRGHDWPSIAARVRDVYAEALR